MTHPDYPILPDGSRLEVEREDDDIAYVTWTPAPRQSIEISPKGETMSHHALINQLRLTASGYIGSAYPTIVEPLLRAARELERMDRQQAVVEAAQAEREAYRNMTSVQLDVSPGTDVTPVDAWIAAARSLIEAVDELNNPTPVVRAL